MSVPKNQSPRINQLLAVVQPCMATPGIILRVLIRRYAQNDKGGCACAFKLPRKLNS